MPSLAFTGGDSTKSGRRGLTAAAVASVLMDMRRLTRADEASLPGGRPCRRRSRGVSRPSTVWLILTLAVAACGVGAEDQARAISSDRLPAPLLSAPASTELTGAVAERREQTVELWFVQGEELVPVEVSMPGRVEPVVLLEALLAGPAGHDVDGSLRSSLVDLELFRMISRSGGVAVVDLDTSFSSLPSGEQLLAAGQVVCSLTSLPGIGTVLFRVHGEVVDVPTGDGTQSSGPVSCDDYRLLIAG